MNKLIFLCLLALSLPIFAQSKATYFHAKGASFSCAKAKSLGERVICESHQEGLQDFDNLLNALYLNALELSKNPGVIKTEQKHWLIQRPSECGPLSDAYHERISQLLQDKNLVQHLCSTLFTPQARLNKEMLLGRDPSYVFCTEIPIADKPNFFLNQLLTAYVINGLVPQQTDEINLPHDMGGTECYRVKDDLYLIAFTSSSGAHNHNYTLFLVRVEETDYKVTQLEIPYFNFNETHKQIDSSNTILGEIGYDSMNQRIHINTIASMMDSHDTLEYEIKDYKLVLIHQRRSWAADSREHNLAIERGEKEDEYGRIWYDVYKRQDGKDKKVTLEQ